MPRRKRSYLPGGAFHITARTHWGEFWFEELRSEIVAILSTALNRTDTLLLAYAIMANHIHLVVRQGIAPLSRLMHTLCQRTAYAVHRRMGRKGYVMGYRYFDTPCRDEAHLRNAILYTHRNPVEAAMCRRADEYQWSSAAAYHGVATSITCAGIQPAIELFASGLPDRTPSQDYADFYAWYDACKQLGPDDPRPYSPGITEGDVFWLDNFTSGDVAERRRADLRDVVLRALAELAPGLKVVDLRGSVRTKRVVAVRTAVVERALNAGHEPVDVARFLNLADSSVSRVNVALARSSKMPS